MDSKANDITWVSELRTKLRKIEYLVMLPGDEIVTLYLVVSRGGFEMRMEPRQDPEDLSVT